MSMFAKIMVVVNLILAVLFLSAAGTLHGATESYKQRLTKEQTDRRTEVENLDKALKSRDDTIKAQSDAAGALRGRAEAAEAQLRQLQDSNTALRMENDRKQSQIEQQNTNVNELTKSNTDLSQRLERAQGAFTTSEAEKNTALQEGATLRENLARETARADNAEKSVKDQEERNKTLADSLDRTSTELAGYKKTYPPLGTSASMKAVSGMVSATDPKYDVHVLSVGTKDGVEIGYEFTVFRGNEYVATIVIDQVGPNYSSGRIKGGSKKSDIRAGDSASTRL